MEALNEEMINIHNMEISSVVNKVLCDRRKKSDNQKKAKLFWWVCGRSWDFPNIQRRNEKWTLNIIVDFHWASYQKICCEKYSFIWTQRGKYLIVWLHAKNSTVQSTTIYFGNRCFQNNMDPSSNKKMRPGKNSSNLTFIFPGMIQVNATHLI